MESTVFSVSELLSGLSGNEKDWNEDTTEYEECESNDRCRCYWGNKGELLRVDEGV